MPQQIFVIFKVFKFTNFVCNVQFYIPFSNSITYVDVFKLFWLYIVCTSIILTSSLPIFYDWFSEYQRRENQIEASSGKSVGWKNYWKGMFRASQEAPARLESLEPHSNKEAKVYH